MSKRRRSRNRAPRPKQGLLTQPFKQPVNQWSPFEILNPDQLETIHNASLDILENTGIDFLDSEALSIWEKAGAKVDHKAEHVWIDRGLLMETIHKAPNQFTWRARNPEKNIVVGGNHLVFGPNGGMVYASDLDRGRRPGVLADFKNFLKLTQVCPHIHFGPWEQVTAHDVPVSLRHLVRLNAGIHLTDKVVSEVAHGRIMTQDNLNMAKILFGDGIEEQPDPVMGDVVNVNSPLRYDDRMLGGLITYARANQVVIVTPFILAGAMSPVTMAAALAQQNAEALAGVALTQLVRPGAPVVYGGFTTNTDLKSGSPAFGTPEGAWALFVGGQLARYYNLPYRGSGGLSNANAEDAQAAYESMWNMWPCVLAHTNMMMHSVGWMEGGLTASFEKFVIDAENLAMFAKFLEGFPIDKDNLALDMIDEVGPGGHHFGTPHTQARYRDIFYQSELADRSPFGTWQESGAQTTAQRANDTWKAWLKAYEQPPLDPAISEALNAYVEKRSQELEGKDLYQ
ncbi:MAG: trimethylamine methyltransferase family protein [Chloroflexota bacterium]